MKFTGKFQSITQDWSTGQINITFSVNEKSVLKEIEKIKKIEILVIEVVKFCKRRSKDANALLWDCLEKIAESIHSDKWNVYLMMLRRYGQFTLIKVKPEAVESVKLQWRECEEVGHVNINGEDHVELLCYFGSSKYNTHEFSVLLDGVISEMEDLGIQPPTSKEMQVALEKWERMKNGKAIV